MFVVLIRRLFDHENNNSTCSDKDFLLIAELYQRYRAFLFKTASKYTDDPYAKEDIVQNTILRLMRRETCLHTMDPAAVMTYIALTVRSAALDYFRIEHRNSLDALPLPSEDDEGYPLYVGNDQITLEEQMLLEHRNEEVRAAIGRLPERDRVALLGKYFLELNNQELAKLLNVKPGAIRTLLCRARGRILKELEKEGILS